MWPQEKLDRRAGPRYGWTCAIRLKLATGDVVAGYTNQIARDGLTVHTDRPIPEHATVEALLHMIHPRNNERLPVALTLHVVYCAHDSVTFDFRSGMQILAFHGDSEDSFMSALGALEHSGVSNVWGETSAKLDSRHYPLRRKVRLALPEGSSRVAWTESISTQAITVALDEPAALASPYAVWLPILPPEDKDWQLIEVATEVASVVLSTSGDYLTTLRFLDLNSADGSLLGDELRQRFGPRLLPGLSSLGTISAP